MERPIMKPIGTPVEELDTPTLVVDIDVLDKNISTMHSFFEGTPAKLRPHVESHRTPAIAHKQAAASGTVGGIGVGAVSQAQVFAASGFTDIFITNLVVTKSKINTLCALARSTRVTVAVDSAPNVADLSEAATANGVTLSVAVNVNVGMDVTGVEPGEQSVELARAVADADGLDFAGLVAYGDSVQPVLDSRQAIEAAGLDVGVVAVGGTGTYEVNSMLDGVTEVHAGSYALMDLKYREQRPQFGNAARVLSTISSVPEEKVAIGDAGQKAVGTDTGLPSFDDLPGAYTNGLSAEHATIQLDKADGLTVELGQKYWITPYDVGTCANLHDYMFAVRDGKLESVWDVSARGMYR